MAEYAVVMAVGFLGVLCAVAALMARPRTSDRLGGLSQDDRVFTTPAEPADR